MQFDSFPPVFDTGVFTDEHPMSPEGELFTYQPLEEPESLHYHDFLELGYCEWGSGLFHVDGEIIPFSGRCCSIIYPGQIHIAQSIGHEKSLWHFLYIDLKHLFPGTELMMVAGLKAMSAHLYDFPALIPYEEDPMLYQLCAMIMQEAAEVKPGHLAAMRGLTSALLTRHSRSMKPARVIRQDQDQILARLGDALNYIRQHYMEDLTVHRLTEATGLSKSTLQRDMIAFTGMAPLQYIHHLRMKRAAVLLTGGMPVAEVAFGVGYNTLSSFNRHFQKEYGVAPTQWRKGNTHS